MFLFFFMFIVYFRKQKQNAHFLEFDDYVVFSLQEVWKTAIHSGAKKSSSSFDEYLLCSAFVVVICKCALK